MPELPEVETIVRGLDKRITGDTIESVWIGSRPQVLKSSAATIAAALEGRKVVRVHRAGKHIVVDLAGDPLRSLSRQLRRSNATSSTRSVRSKKGPLTNAPLPAGQWIIHLGMTGRTIVCEPSEEIVKHTHLIAKLASGRELRFIDPRMFGKLS